MSRAREGPYHEGNLTTGGTIPLGGASELGTGIIYTQLYTNIFGSTNQPTMQQAISGATHLLQKGGHALGKSMKMAPLIDNLNEFPSGKLQVILLWDQSAGT